LELLEVELLGLLLLPLTTAAGIALPLAMKLVRAETRNAGSGIGILYGVNTAGCIAGTLMTGWLLVPYIGTERTLYLGALANAVLGIVVLPKRYSSLTWRAAPLGLAVMALAGLVFPRWDLAAMTAGAYK
jgi:spermidine synthase